MKALLSILVILLVTFSGIALAQEAEAPSAEPSSVESAPSESAPTSEESSDASEPSTVSPPAAESESNENANADSPASTESAATTESIETNDSSTEVAPTVVETMDVETPKISIDDATAVETTLTNEEPSADSVIIIDERADTREPIAETPSGGKDPSDDGLVIVVTPVGPVEDASGTEIIVTPGPVLEPCTPHGSCGDERPPSIQSEKGPGVKAKCPINKPNCQTPTPDDDDPAPISESSNDDDTGSNAPLFAFNPLWAPTVGPSTPTTSAAPTPIPAPSPVIEGTLEIEGPDPAIVALADGRPKPEPAPVVSETPTPSSITGLFTGANASVIGTGLLVLLGAFVIFRGRKK